MNRVSQDSAITVLLLPPNPYIPFAKSLNLREIWLTCMQYQNDNSSLKGAGSIRYSLQNPKELVNTCC